MAVLAVLSWYSVGRIEGEADEQRRLPDSEPVAVRSMKEQGH